MTAKFHAFQKALREEVKAVEKSGCIAAFDLFCFGDNEFEHAAFQHVVERSPYVRTANIIRCTQGKSSTFRKYVNLCVCVSMCVCAPS